MAGITTLAVLVIFVFGTYTDMIILSDGVSAIGVGAHWWVAAPAIVTSVIAILSSVKEIAGY